MDVHAHGGLLPPFLIEHGGLNSGFMMVQYTAAALVRENKSLAHPASVDSIPTSANQEDHVSMGPIAARHARAIMRNTGRGAGPGTADRRPGHRPAPPRRRARPCAWAGAPPPPTPCCASSVAYRTRGCARSPPTSPGPTS